VAHSKTFSVLLEFCRLISLSTVLCCFGRLCCCLIGNKFLSCERYRIPETNVFDVESKGCPPLTGIRRPSFASDAVNRTDGTVSIVNRSGLHQTLYVTSIGLCHRSVVLTSSSAAAATSVQRRYSSNLVSSEHIGLYIGWNDVRYMWSQYDRHFVGQHRRTVCS